MNVRPKTYNRNSKKVSGLLGMLIMCAIFCAGCEKTIPYSMEQQKTEYDASLYSFADKLEGMESIVCTARYDDDEILIYEELLGEDGLHKKVWLFSYLTGEKKLCCDHVQALKNSYLITNERFELYSSNPLVLLDTYEDEMYIYTDDFAAYSVIDMNRKETALEVYRGNAGLFFMDNFTGKVYYNTLDGFRTETVQMDFGALLDASDVVFEPDINMTSCSFVGASEGGKKLRLQAQSLIDKEYYYFDYDLENKEYTEVYNLSEDEECLWQDWDYKQCLKEVKPSAVPRFTYTDYVKGKEYACKIETEHVYSYVLHDEIYASEDFEGKKQMPLFYVVDEKEEVIVDVLLWDYENAESEPVKEKIEKISCPYPKEINYNELTEKAECLEEKYGVTIVMGENVRCRFEAYDYLQVTDEERIKLALDELEKALNVFPDGMCQEMVSGNATGFNIYLCGDFTPKSEDYIVDAGAFHVYDNGCYNLVLNIMQDNTEANVVHEMTHALDTYFGFCDVLDNLDADWAMCNPEGFEYLDSYFGYEEDYTYTYWDVYENINDVYFCDTYAKTFPGEDRSRVFEYFGSTLYENDVILESASLQRKAGLLLDYCEEYLECFRTDEAYGMKMQAERYGF